MVIVHESCNRVREVSPDNAEILLMLLSSSSTRVRLVSPDNAEILLMLLYREIQPFVLRRLALTTLRYY